jgi:hypothetical protein
MSVIVNTRSSSLASPLLLLVTALSLGACGDDDKVNPSNPDASALKDGGAPDGERDAFHDASEDVHADARRDGSEDAGKMGEDAAPDAAPE